MPERAWGNGSTRPSDTASQYTRWLGFHQYPLVVGVPGEPQSEGFVELRSLFRVGVGEHGDVRGLFLFGC